VATRKELAREVTLWKQAMEHYDREHAEWLKEKEALEAQHPVLATKRAAKAFEEREIEKILEQLRAAAPYRA
jgi:hypothetical protein